RSSDRSPSAGGGPGRRTGTRRPGSAPATVPGGGESGLPGGGPQAAPPTGPSTAIERRSRSAAGEPGGAGGPSGQGTAPPSASGPSGRRNPGSGHLRP